MCACMGELKIWFRYSWKLQNRTPTGFSSLDTYFSKPGACKNLSFIYSIIFTPSCFPFLKSSSLVFYSLTSSACVYTLDAAFHFLVRVCVHCDVLPAVASSRCTKKQLRAEQAHNIASLGYFHQLPVICRSRISCTRSGTF